MSVRQLCAWHVYPDSGQLTLRAGEGIARVAEQAIAARGAFHIVLAGGATPRPIYQYLAGIAADWSRWHIYFGDERCLPSDHPERNSVMARAAWLGQVGIPPDQTHVIPAELGAVAAAGAYAATVQGVELFDLVLLGLGEDGHTASLFPAHDWGEDAASSPVLAVAGAPKAPAERVSLSAWRLSRARRVWFLVGGCGKKEVVAAWQDGENIPAGAIRPPGGVDVFVEECCYERKDHG
jgi:6-phosphogluconolactonase